MKKNVLIIRSSCFKTARTTRAANEYLKHGYSVTVVYFKREDLSNGELDNISELKKRGIVVIEYEEEFSYGTGIKGALKRMNWLRFVHRVIIESSADIVHAVDLDSSLILLISSKKNRYFIADYADYIEDYPLRFSTLIKPILRSLTFLVSKRSDTVLLPSERRQKDYMSNVLIVNNAPQIEVTHHPSKKNNKHVILYCGTLGRDRGVEQLLDVAKNSEILEKFEIRIAGWGELESKVCSSNGLTFLGHLNYNQVLQETIRCDFVYCVYDPNVLVNKHSDPNKFYEAINLGKALIVSEGTGIDEDVSEKKFGLVVRYETHSIKNALAGCSEIDLDKMKLNALKYKDEYSWARSLKSFEELFAKIEHKLC